METPNTESLADLDSEYHRLHAEHQDHEQRLRELAIKPRLSEEEELEEGELPEGEVPEGEEAPAEGEAAEGEADTGSEGEPGTAEG